MNLLWLLQTSAIAGLIWMITESIRRLYFHPISHIPGPRLAALTWWYEFHYDFILSGKYVFKIQELHEQYGSIIRVTPDEIHVNDVGLLDQIYAPAMIPRDKYAYQLRSLRLPGGVGTTADYRLHKVRREGLAPFFSKKSIMQLERIITEKVGQLRDVIMAHKSNGKVVNLSDLLFAFANDVVTNFCFAHKVNVLGDKKKAATLRQNSKELVLEMHFNKQFPQVADILEWLPTSVSRPIMPAGLIDLFGLFDKTLDRIEKDGVLLVLAGTESPVKTMDVIFYHVLSNHAILNRLRQELRALPQDETWTWSQLEQLPYL
ncbi:cytochrome P450 [Aspergillus stella-maris]|uniref:cytochrome P450 n=1 Tax=Aspergillus stella-maris TaxID=1810926 RepID=UPI003CCD5AE8